MVESPRQCLSEDCVALGIDVEPPRMASGITDKQMYEEPKSYQHEVWPHLDRHDCSCNGSEIEKYHHQPLAWVERIKRAKRCCQQRFVQCEDTHKKSNQCHGTTQDHALRVWTGVATGEKVAKSLSFADGSNADKQANRRNDGAEEFQNQGQDGLWFSIVRLSLWFRFSCMQETRRSWPIDALGLLSNERARALAHGEFSQRWEDEARANGDIMPLEGGTETKRWTQRGPAVCQHVEKTIVLGAFPGVFPSIW